MAQRLCVHTNTNRSPFDEYLKKKNNNKIERKKQTMISVAVVFADSVFDRIVLLFCRRFQYSIGK